MRQVTQAYFDGVRPSLSCVLTKHEVRGIPIIVVEVPSFTPDRPYRAGNTYYIRDANRCREATPDELKRLLQSEDYHFDEQSVRGATREDMDPGAVRSLIETLYHGAPVAEENVNSYLRAIRLVDEADIPTVSGVLFLSRDPTRWLIDARISAVRFEGVAMSDKFRDRSDIVGRLPDQIDLAHEFLSRHLASPSEVKGWDRVENRGPGDIPADALREAVLNAVSHRDYRMASQIRLFIFDDRVEIVNPGGLLNRLNLDNIKSGITQRRNPVVASLLPRLAKRENIGFGIPEMIRLMRERGFPEPGFELQGGHFRVVLRVRPAATL